MSRELNPNQKMAKLRTGVEVPEAVIYTVLANMRLLKSKYLDAFTDVMFLARSPRHRLRTDPKILWAHGMVNDSGVMHDYVRAVVLASLDPENVANSEIQDPRAEG